MFKQPVSLPVPGNMLASEFNRHYVEPILENASNFAQRFAPLNGPDFFQYILQSKENSAQGSIEKHKRLALAYFELPTLCKKELFSHFIARIPYLDTETIIALFQSTQKTHSHLLLKHPKENISLLSYLIKANVLTTVIQYLVSILDEEAFYFDNILTNKPFACAAEKNQSFIIEYLQNKGIIDIPTFPLDSNQPSINWHEQHPMLFAIELLPSGASGLEKSLQSNIQRFFEILTRDLSEQRESSKIGPCSIPINNALIIELIKILLFKGPLIMPNEEARKETLKLLYNHHNHTEKQAVLRMMNKNIITTEQMIITWLIDEIINKDTFYLLEKDTLPTVKRISENLKSLLSIYNPKLQPAFERLFSIIKMKKKESPHYKEVNQLFFQAIQIGATSYVEFILQNHKKILSPFPPNDPKMPILIFTMDSLIMKPTIMWEIIHLLRNNGFCEIPVFNKITDPRGSIKHEIRTTYLELHSKNAEVKRHKLSKSVVDPWPLTNAPDRCLLFNLTYQKNHVITTTSTEKKAYSFPEDIFNHIFSYLPFDDMINCADVYWSHSRAPINRILKEAGIITDTETIPFPTSTNNFPLIAIRNHSDCDKQTSTYINWFSTITTLICHPFGFDVEAVPKKEDKIDLINIKNSNNVEKNFQLLLILQLFINHPQLPNEVTLRSKNLFHTIEFFIDLMNYTKKFSKIEIDKLFLEYFFSIGVIRRNRAINSRHVTWDNRGIFYRGSREKVCIQDNHLSYDDSIRASIITHNYIKILQDVSQNNHGDLTYAKENGFIIISKGQCYRTNDRLETTNDIQETILNSHIYTENQWRLTDISSVPTPIAAMHYSVCWPIFPLYRAIEKNEAMSNDLILLSHELVASFFKQLKTYICEVHWPTTTFCFFNQGRSYRGETETIIVPTEVYTQLKAIDDYLSKKIIFESTTPTTNPNDTNRHQQFNSTMKKALKTVIDAAYQGFKTRLIVSQKKTGKKSPSYYRGAFIEECEYAHLISMKDNPESTYFIEFTSGILIRNLWNQAHPNHRSIGKELRDVYFSY